MMMEDEEELCRVAGIGEEAMPMVSISVQTAGGRKPPSTQNQDLAGEPAMATAEDAMHSDSAARMPKPGLFPGEQDMASPKEQEAALQDLTAGESQHQSFAMASESRALSTESAVGSSQPAAELEEPPSADLEMKTFGQEPIGEGESEALCTVNSFMPSEMQEMVGCGGVDDGRAPEISRSPLPAAGNLASREAGEQAGKTMDEAGDSHGDELQADLHPVVAVTSSAVAYPNGSEITEGKQVHLPGFPFIISAPPVAMYTQYEFHGKLDLIVMF